MHKNDKTDTKEVTKNEQVTEMYCVNSVGEYVRVNVINYEPTSVGATVEFKEPFRFHVFKNDKPYQYYFERGERIFVPSSCLVKEKPEENIKNS